MPKLPPKVLRHKAEIPLVRLSVLLIAVAIAIALAIVTHHKALPAWVQATLAVIIAGPLIFSITIRYQYWQAITNAVEVTEHQFPDIYALFTDAAARIGLDKRPKLFILNGNGLLNAYASKCTLRKKYIVIYSDLVDIYYEQSNEDLLRFTLSHELGHVYLGHVNIRRTVLNAALKIIYFSNTLTRAQEYSADRVAASVTAQGTRALALLPFYAGKHVHLRASVEQYIANDVPDQSRFWLAVVSFMATHPVGKRRIATLNRMDHEDWQGVHGKML